MSDRETTKLDNEKLEIERKYAALSESEKKEIVEKVDKRNKQFIIFSVICIIGLIILTVTRIIGSDSYDWWKGAILNFIFICMGIAVFGSSVSELKMNEEQKIRKNLKMQIRQKAKEKEREIREKEWRKSVYDDENIVRVTLIDSYTEVHDKLHAILNYQEIIQTRYYKFKVDYSNGKSVIVTTEDGSTEYRNLIRRLNSGESETSADNVKNSAEELREYKELLDEGIITEEEFNERKKKLLNS